MKIIISRHNKMDIVFVIKVVIFAFIITSPFYNVGQVLKWLDSAVAKFLLLALVVASSFVDMQLALLAAIAYFILLMYFYMNSQPKDAPKDDHSPLRTQIASGLPNGLLFADSLTDSVKNSMTDSLPYPISPLSDSLAPSPVITYPHVPVAPIPPVPKESALSDFKGSSEKVQQTMYEFPEVKCKAPVEANDAFMNETILNYFIDDKVKPYEDFISQLTNEELLESVSNGAFLSK